MTTKTDKPHYHVWLSGWKDGKPPTALIRGDKAFRSRTAANVALARDIPAKTRTPANFGVVMQCYHPDCTDHAEAA